MRNLFAGAIVLLGFVSVIMAVGIIYGEANDRWFLGGGLVGAVLVAYSFIFLFLRKLGIIGPRKAER